MGNSRVVDTDGIGERAPSTVRIAAAGDIHCRESLREDVQGAFAALRDRAQLVLLAGDLTAHGEPEEARVLAEAARECGVPVVAVLGNHDWHAGRVEEVTSVLVDAGIEVLDRGIAIHEVNGTEVGIVGTKGFVGGFSGSHLPDFGEPLLREVYAETSAEVAAIDRGLAEVAVCPVRIVLLHYSPSEQTLEGEPEGIRTFLGSERLAEPIRQHTPDLVLHGHAHSGMLEGSIGDVPVFNVSVPVIGRDFWVVELSGVERSLTPIH